METKVRILGKSEAEKPELKKIEFIKYLLIDDLTCARAKPSEYKNVLLLGKNYNHAGIDLMYAYNEDVDMGILYLGHFNDGVV